MYILFYKNHIQFFSIVFQKVDLIIFNKKKKITEKVLVINQKLIVSELLLFFEEELLIKHFQRDYWINYVS